MKGTQQPDRKKHVRAGKEAGRDLHYSFCQAMGQNDEIEDPKRDGMTDARQ
jgi:hypothetical protein